MDDRPDGRIDQCDYGGCDKEVYGGFYHEGREHNFCKYHYERVNP